MAALAARVLALVLLLSLSSLSAPACPEICPPPGTPSMDVFCVDMGGCCNFTTVQAAIDAVPENSTKRSLIWISAGTYMEKVLLPRAKVNVTFQGQGLGSTVIEWNDTATSAHGTRYSASVDVLSDGFIPKNISFKNSAPAPQPGAQGQQAVAMKISGDKAAFWRCGFYGNQDTLMDDKHRHYFKECFIQGSIDFIFGNERSLYQDCTLNSVAKAEPKGKNYVTGAVTAQGREFAENNTGFVFVNCNIQGSGYVYLGRAWGAYARVIFSKTSMSDIVAKEGWNDWENKTSDGTVFFAEHDCNGDGSNRSGRVGYAKQLSDEEAQRFVTLDYINGTEWL